MDLAAGSYRFGLVFYDEPDEGGARITPTFDIFRVDASQDLTLNEKTIGPHGSGADFEWPDGTKSVTLRPYWALTPTGDAWMDDVEFFRSDKQSITDIDIATVDGTREDEFKRVILQYKPLHSWAALIVNFA